MRYILLFATLLSLVSAGVPDLSAADPAGTQFVATIGPAELVRGPDQASDTAFHTLTRAAGLRSYVANGTTWTSLGGSLETLPRQTAVAIGPGSGFDSCGAWLNSTWQDGTTVRGWYHAETECAYPATLKSVAYAESIDGGKTFTKPNYPDNQVITAPGTSRAPKYSGEGDHHVIRNGDYLYMYFIASRDYQVRVARSRIADGGKPGTWYKYYRGAFIEPGLGGESDPIDPSGALTRSWVTYNTYLNAYLGFSYEVHAGKFAGFGLMMSPDGVTGWTRLGGIVQSSGDEYWGRTGNSPELAEYPSLLSLYGDSETTGSTFWLYFTYLRPGEDFPDGRYLLRRLVRLDRTTSTDARMYAPRVALSVYQHEDDTWTATTVADARYTRTSSPGYLFTQAVANTVPVYDCYIPFWSDHMLVPNDPTCAGGNVQVLGRIGWISTVAFPGAVAVYRCWDEAATNHFISNDPTCGGKQTEWRLGYLAQSAAPTPAPVVAVSAYFDRPGHDSWATNILPGAPYAFQRRLGYLYREAAPGRAPMYDCYIPGWHDHMATVYDATCDGNQVLGRMGWIAEEPFAGGVALYRCWDGANTNHFLSLDSTCGGATLEWRAGYVIGDAAVGAYTETGAIYLPALGK